MIESITDTIISDVDKKMEIKSADGIGKRDYASLSNGGGIVLKKKHLVLITKL